MDGITVIILLEFSENKSLTFDVENVEAFLTDKFFFSNNFIKKLFNKIKLFFEICIYRHFWICQCTRTFD